jgi:hypothetical protein
MTQVIDFRLELLFCVASSLILLLAAFALKLREDALLWGACCSKFRNSLDRNRIVSVGG